MNIHVTAYGILPISGNLQIKVKPYQLQVIQVSSTITFLGARGEISIGNEMATLTIQSKAVWESSETGLVDRQLMISTNLHISKATTSVKLSVKAMLKFVLASGVYLFVCLYVCLFVFVMWLESCIVIPFWIANYMY